MSIRTAPAPPPELARSFYELFSTVVLPQGSPLSCRQARPVPLEVQLLTNHFKPDLQAFESAVLAVLQ